MAPASPLAQELGFADTSRLGPSLLLPLLPHPRWGPGTTQAPSPGLCCPVGEGCQPRSPPSWVPSGLVPLGVHLDAASRAPISSCQSTSCLRGRLAGTGERPESQGPWSCLRAQVRPCPLSLSCVCSAHIKLASPGTSPAVQRSGLYTIAARGLVRSLVGDLRSHKPHSSAKNKQINKQQWDK